MVHWDMRSGNCVRDLGEYGVGVVKVEATRESTVGLFAENTVIVWDNFSGETLYTLAMVSGQLALLWMSRLIFLRFWGWLIVE